jgi:hypothetical protein
MMRTRSRPCHCEEHSDEAITIQVCTVRRDCFGSLAMTTRERASDNRNLVLIEDLGCNGMKMLISKVDAARRQTLEAIRMFFEQRDAVSIHTLVCAAMQILHDHFDEGTAWDANLAFHFHSIYIKNEYRKEWKNKVNGAANFFKHAREDLKEGKTEIEFSPNITNFYIFEVIRCLRILEDDKFIFSPEFRVFAIWYALKYPTHIKVEARAQFTKLKNPGVDDYKSFRDVISLMAANPNLMENAANLSAHAGRADPAEA